MPVSDKNRITLTKGLVLNLISILIFSAVLLGAPNTVKCNETADSNATTTTTQQAMQEIKVESNRENPILPEIGASIDAFVPDGWRLIKHTSGDLNEDGYDDIAGVIEYGKPYSKKALEKAPPRILFIALRDDDGYRLSIPKDNFILTADQGGVWGDPFNGISVDRGSLLIKFYGGSNYRWTYDYRFRYQNDRWYLIGFTAKNWFTGTGAGKEEDYNLLTGVEIISTIDKNVVVNEEVINRGIKELVNLKDASGPFDAKSRI